MTLKTVFKKSKNAVKRFMHMKYNKYIVVLILGVLIVGFMGENSVVAHLRNKHRISELKAEIEANIAQTEANQEQLYKLMTDPKAVERVGRERYFMSTDDEDVFVLSDDPTVNTQTGIDDATAE